MSEEIKKVEYDKSEWPKGEWDNEPDRIDFIHAGFSCFILRNRLGAWCGYVGVPKDHPLYKVHYNDCDNFDVHGGLTYSDVCSGHICHVPQEGMPGDVWWLGFDTGHINDFQPGLWSIESKYFGIGERGSYKNVDYATEETKQLAEQLRDYDNEQRGKREVL